MWSAAVRLLFAASALNARDPGTRILDSPTNLSLGHESPTHVALYWNFTEPEYTDLADVLFDILVRDETDSLEWFQQKSYGRPFHFALDDLKPNTKYTLKLWASHPKLKSSPIIEKSFTTMQDDWATPVITDVTPKKSGDFVNYSLRWELPHESEHLSHFDVVVCAYACHGTRAGPHDFNATVPVPFYVSFTLNVDAFYDVPVVGVVKRESATFEGRSAMGAPSKVQHLTKISQVGNQFIIHWMPPRPANGPLSYHEVIVYDPMKPFRASWVNVTFGARAIVTAPAIQGDLYKIRIRAVNVDSDRTLHKGEFAVFDFERETIPKTFDVEVLHRLPDLVHFRVLTAHPQDNMIFDVEASVSLRRIYQKSDEIEAIDLKPFQTFSVSVRPCYPTKDSNTHTCGEFSRFKLVSNVESPSEVRNLHVRLSEDDFIIASWDAPLVRNGPVDRYNVHFQFTEGDSLDTEAYEFRDKTPYLRHKKPKKWQEFRMGVAAVNRDLDDHKTEHVSPMVWMKPAAYQATQKTQGLSSLNFGLIVLCVVIIIGVFLRYLDAKSTDPSPERLSENEYPPPYESPSPQPENVERRGIALDSLGERRAVDQPHGVSEQGI